MHRHIALHYRYTLCIVYVTLPLVRIHSRFHLLWLVTIWGTEVALFLKSHGSPGYKQVLRRHPVYFLKPLTYTYTVYCEEYNITSGYLWLFTTCYVDAVLLLVVLLFYMYCKCIPAVLVLIYSYWVCLSKDSYSHTGQSYLMLFKNLLCFCVWLCMTLLCIYKLSWLTWWGPLTPNNQEAHAIQCCR